VIDGKASLLQIAFDVFPIPSSKKSDPLLQLGPSGLPNRNRNLTLTLRRAEKIRIKIKITIKSSALGLALYLLDANWLLLATSAIQSVPIR
jgi:hypothetical protein